MSLSSRWLWVVVILFLTVYLFLSLTLHYRYNTTDADLAIYTQHVWFLSQGDFLGYGGTFKDFSIFGDHFIVHFFWISLIMKLFQSASVLIIVQTLAIVFSSIPVYLLAKERLNDKLSATILSVIYLLFYGYQAAEIFPFHGAALSSFFISFTLWFAYKRNWFWYWLALVGALFAKEDISTFGFVLGIYLFIRGDRKVGLITSLISAIYFYIVIFQVMPFFTQGRPYAYFVQSQNSKIFNPLRVVVDFFYPFVKTRTLLTLFGSFGFLPLFSLTGLFLAFPFLLARFTSVTIQRWLPWMHYSANQGAILGFGSVWGLENLYNLLNRISLFTKVTRDKILFYRGYLVFCLILTISISFFYKMPLLNLLKPEFYKTPAGVQGINEAISLIPRDPQVSVAAQSGLLPHLALRRKIYMYPHPSNSIHEPSDDLEDSAPISEYAVPDVDYIILSKHAFHWRPSSERFDEVISYVKQLPKYRTIFDKDSTVVLQKIT